MAGEAYTWAILACYVAVLFALALWRMRRCRDIEGYYVAGRGFGTLMIGAGLAATVIGASVTLSATDLVRSVGASGAWMTLAPVLFLILLFLTLAGKVRKTEALTLPEIVEKLYDRRTRVASAVLIVMAEVAWTTLLLVATAMLLTTFFGVSSIVAGLILAGLVFVLYTAIGGRYADIYTDGFQLVFMLLMMLILVPLSISYAGGFEALGRLPAPIRSFPVSTTFGLVDIFSIMVLLGLSFLVGPDVYSMLLSSKDSKSARYGALLAAGLMAIWTVFIVLLGLSAAAANATGGSVFFLLQNAVGNPVLQAFLVSGLVAVMMSSADTTLLNASLTFSNDILPSINRKRSIGSLDEVRSAQLVVGIFGIVAVVLGYQYVRDTANPIMEILRLGYTVFTAGVVLPVVAGFYKKATKVTSRAATWAMLVGGVVSLLVLYSPKLLGFQGTIMTMKPGSAAVPVGLLACFIVLFVGSRMLKE